MTAPPTPAAPQLPRPVPLTLCPFGCGLVPWDDHACRVLSGAIVTLCADPTAVTVLP